MQMCAHALARNITDSNSDGGNGGSRTSLKPAAIGADCTMLPSDIADAYKLLGITTEARDDEINKAFRQRSLKVHPDRNPDNPEAGECFCTTITASISF